MSAMLMPASPSTPATAPIMPGPVVVADDEHVPAGGHVDGVVVDHHDARLAPQADQRAADGVVAAPDGDQVDVVVGGRVDLVSRTSTPRSSASCGALT